MLDDREDQLTSLLYNYEFFMTKEITKTLDIKEHRVSELVVTSSPFYYHKKQVESYDENVNSLNIKTVIPSLSHFNIK